MGIKNLLVGLRSITDDVHLKEYFGLTVAIDGYTWIHKGAFACAEELALGRHSEKWISFCEKRLALLQQNNVKPYFVFDGNNLPAKQGTEIERQQRRTDSLQKAKDARARGDSMAAQNCFSAAVDVSPAMVSIWLNRLRLRNIPFIVAPYEADAQLAYLAINGHVQAVLTEDSDLIPYGVDRVLFKLDKDGNGKQIRRQDLGRCEEHSFTGWTDDMILNMCILAGCDYLPSPPGMAVKRAHEFISKAGSGVTVKKMLSKLQLERGVNKEYCDGFEQARLTFLHQRVIDPISKKMVHLRPLPAHLQEWVRVSPTCLDFMGPALSDDHAAAIADGHLDPTTMQPYPPPPPSAAPQAPPSTSFLAATAYAGGSGRGAPLASITHTARGNASLSAVPNPNVYAAIGASAGSGRAAVKAGGLSSVNAGLPGGIFGAMRSMAASASSPAFPSPTLKSAKGSTAQSMPAGQGRGGAIQRAFGLAAASSRRAAESVIVEIDDDSLPGVPVHVSHGAGAPPQHTAAGAGTTSRHFGGGAAAAKGSSSSALSFPWHQPSSSSASSPSVPVDMMMEMGGDRQVLVLGDRTDEPSGIDPYTEVVSHAGSAFEAQALPGTGVGSRYAGLEAHSYQGNGASPYPGPGPQPGLGQVHGQGPVVTYRGHAGKGTSKLPASAAAGGSSVPSMLRGNASVTAKLAGASSVLVGPLGSPGVGMGMSMGLGIAYGRPRLQAQQQQRSVYYDALGNEVEGDVEDGAKENAESMDDAEGDGPSRVDRLSNFAYSGGQGFGAGATSGATATPVSMAAAPLRAAALDWKELEKKGKSEAQTAQVHRGALMAAPAHASAHVARGVQRMPSVIPGTVGPAGMLTGSHASTKGLMAGTHVDHDAVAVTAGKKRVSSHGKSPAQPPSAGRSPVTRSASKRVRLGADAGAESSPAGVLDTSGVMPVKELAVSTVFRGGAGGSSRGVMPPSASTGMGYTSGHGEVKEPHTPAIALQGALHGLNPSVLRNNASGSNETGSHKVSGLFDQYGYGMGAPSPAAAAQAEQQGSAVGLMAKFNRQPGGTSKVVAEPPRGRVQLSSGMVNFNLPPVDGL